MTRTEMTYDAGFVAIAVAASAAGVPVVLELLGTQPAWPMVLRLHGLSVVLLAVYVTLHTRTRLRRRLAALLADGDQRETDARRHLTARAFYAWYLLVATAVFGAVGAAATGCGFVLFRRHARHSRTFEEWYRELFPERGRRIYERIYDELMLTRRQRESRGQIVPFADVINYGSREQKQLAISMMSRHFEPPFAPVLKRALEDPNNSVRIQAATAITNLEGRFSDRSMELEARIARDPSPRHVIDFARHLDRYAFSGLLDADRTARVRARAIELYRAYLEDEPDDLFARIAVGRLLLRTGDEQGAREWLLAARARHGPHPSLNNWLLESHYALGDYAAVRALAREIVGEHRSDTALDVLSASARMWAGLPPPGEQA